MSGFRFGPHILIAERNVFAVDDLVYAFVNLKPVVSGHVLVATKRVCQRYVDMSAPELRQLHLMSQKVVRMLDSVYPENTGSTIVIQDGAGAGQTVPSVHIHVMPRRPADFSRNDDIYDELERTDSARKPRGDAEMTAEAKLYRQTYLEVNGP